MLIAKPVNDVIGCGNPQLPSFAVANLAGCAFPVCVKAGKAGIRSIAYPFPIEAGASIGVRMEGTRERIATSLCSFPCARVPRWEVRVLLAMTKWGFVYTWKQTGITPSVSYHIRDTLFALLV